MNINTNDIYIKVDSEIVEKGFWTADTESKKLLIEAGITKFSILKMKQLGLNHLLGKEEVINLNDLLKLINSRLTSVEEKEEFFRHYTHYILKIAGCIQEYSIVWWQEDELEFEENPLIEFDNNGLWSSLKTHSKTSSLKTTMFVLDIFKNQFGLQAGKQKINMLKA